MRYFRTGVEPLYLCKCRRRGGGLKENDFHGKYHTDNHQEKRSRDDKAPETLESNWWRGQHHLKAFQLSFKFNYSKPMNFVNLINFVTSSQVDSVT